jgi:DNA replication protein DnaC
MSKTSELTHIFRALKAPAAARAMGALAERARGESWSHERFLEAVLSTEIASRESHGGESRIKAARFPARKTLEEFDFTFQRPAWPASASPSRPPPNGSLGSARQSAEAPLSQSSAALASSR